MEFGNIDDLVTDKDLELGGIVVDLGKGRWLKGKRAGGANREYQVALAEESKPYREKLRLGTMTEEDVRLVHGRTLARAVVLDWGGFKDKAGKSIPFSPENLVAFFDASPDSFWAVKEAFESMANFREKEIAEEKKDLGKSSHGTTALEIISAT